MLPPEQGRSPWGQDGRAKGAVARGPGLPPRALPLASFKNTSTGSLWNLGVHLQMAGIRSRGL